MQVYIMQYITIDKDTAQLATKSSYVFFLLLILFYTMVLLSDRGLACFASYIPVIGFQSI